jgi:lysophospholipase L1-like esterase
VKLRVGARRATLLITAIIAAACAPERPTLTAPVEPSPAAQPAAALAAAYVPNAPNDPSIQYVGRWDFSTPTKPKTAWPGTGMVVAFAGTSIRASFTEDNSNNRLLVSIDGAAPVTVRLARGTATVVLAQGLSNTTHLLRLVKKTEGCCGAANFAFLGFQLDAGKTLLAPPARPSLRLDFYGDSHAAGYSAECSCNSQETGFKNAAYAYPALVGQLLNAEIANQSWSGIGIFNGYATNTMPQVFDRTLQSDVSPLWDFSRYTPDAVVVNLGDNDVIKGATKAQIMTAMQGFVATQLRPRYPNAHIVLAASYGWSYNESANYVHEIAGALQGAGDAKVSWVRLPWLSGQEHRVYCEQAGHANILAAHLAAQLGLPAPTPSPVSCVPGAETVTNGDLERDALPTDAGADGWRAFVSRGTVAVRTGGAHSGSRFVQLTPKAGYAGMYQATDAIPGRLYSASASLRKSTAGTATARLRLEFRDQAQNLISEQVAAPTVGNAWGQFSLSGRAPAGTWQVRVVAVSDNGAVIDVDTITLTASD